jgi:hypothetical protein
MDFKFYYYNNRSLVVSNKECIYFNRNEIRFIDIVLNK